jgi:hypothetical protein
VVQRLRRSWPKTAKLQCYPPDQPPLPGEASPETQALEAQRKAFRATQKADCENTEEYLNEGARCPNPSQQNDLCRGVARAVERLDALADAERRRATRELDRHAIPDTSTFFYAILVEASGNYDRVSAYDTDDVKLPARDISSYGLSLGPRLDLYLAPTWAFSLGSGAELTREPAFATAKRCTNLTSSDDSISGQSCKDVRLLGDEPDSAWSFYAQASAMYLFRDLVEGALPGTELRVQVTGLGQDAELKARFTSFLSPITGPALTRFGFGVDLLFPLYDDAESGIESAKLHDIAPFLLVGASL